VIQLERLGAPLIDSLSKDALCSLEENYVRKVRAAARPTRCRLFDRDHFDEIELVFG